MDLQDELKIRLMEISELFGKVAESIKALCGSDGDVKEEPEQLELPLFEENKPVITLEQVRGFLAEKSRDGFTSDVKSLIAKFGATRLSEVKPEDYEAIMKEAEGFGHA